MMPPFRASYQVEWLLWLFLLTRFPAAPLALTRNPPTSVDAIKWTSSTSLSASCQARHYHGVFHKRRLVESAVNGGGVVGSSSLTRFQGDRLWRSSAAFRLRAGSDEIWVPTESSAADGIVDSTTVANEGGDLNSEDVLSIAQDSDNTFPFSAVQATLSKALQYANKNFFLVGMFVAVLLAKTVPALGQNGGLLRPELFIGNYGVTLIFLLSGLSLQTSELTKAIANVKLNGLVQFLIFVVWPFGIGVPLQYILNRLFVPFNLLPPALVDGILIMTTLPTTVNMCIMLTSASGGNVASSICNAVLSNMGGILVTPLLLLHFFGATIQLPFATMVWKLCQKVLVPVAVGQMLRRTTVKDVYQQHSKVFKRLQEVILLGIVWNAFCNAFAGDGLGLAFKHSLVLLALLPALHFAALGAFFKFFSQPQLKLSRADTVAATFCASQKTLAFGLPLVNTIFQGHANLAAYCAPIMFIHPLQMTIGSLFLPTIEKYTAGDIQDQNIPKG